MALTRSKIVAILAIVTAASLGGAYYWKNKMDQSEESTDQAIENADIEKSKQPTAAPPKDSSQLASIAKGRGNKFYNEKKLDEAIECYDEAIGLFPSEHPELRLTYANRAACHLLKGDYQNVVNDCTKALEMDKNFIKALDRRSKAYEALGNELEAFVDATAACLIDDFKSKAFAERVDSLIATYVQKASSESSQVDRKDLPSKLVVDEFFGTFPLELKQLSELKEDDIPESLLQFIQSIQSKDWVGADNLVSKIVSNEIIDCKEDLKVVCLNWLVNFDFLKGNLENCKKSLELIFSIDSNNSAAMIKMALVLTELNLMPEAVSYLERSEPFSQFNPTFYYYRGELLALSRRPELAIKDFSKALELEPTFIGAITRKVRCLLEIENISEAKEILEEKSKELPFSIELKHAAAECYALLGDLEQSFSVLDAIERLDQNFAASYFTRALIELKSGSVDIDKVAGLLRRSLEIDPRFQEARLQLAGLLARMNKRDEADEEFSLAAANARTFQQQCSVHSLRIAAISQSIVCERYPELNAKIQ